jgi:uncharacterized protein
MLDSVLHERLARPRQTVFVSGPRQVGKTTPCRALASVALDWRDLRDRRVILSGPAAVVEQLGLVNLRDRDAVVLFDNLRAYNKWPAFLRGIRARCGPRLRILVTGLDSARATNTTANFSHLRLHPWSVGEWLRAGLVSSTVAPPAAICDEDWNVLVEHGGFPEPFLKRDSRFTRRWQSQRAEELLSVELRTLTAVHDPQVFEALALLLAEQSAAHVFYSHLSREVSVTVDTVRRWVDLLTRAQYGFLVRPWFRGVPKALRKEPKWFLRDWSAIGSSSARRLTFIACHLLKAVEGWTDLGFGRFELCYVRDKSKREADFLVVRDGKPWFLVGVGDEPRVMSVLQHFQECTRAAHAFQVVFDGAFTAADCFERHAPVAVSARTFLSQLP